MKSVLTVPHFPQSEQRKLIKSCNYNLIINISFIVDNNVHISISYMLTNQSAISKHPKNSINMHIH